MNCIERMCVQEHQGLCEIKSVIGELGLCEEFEEVTEANEAERQSLEF